MSDPTLERTYRCLDCLDGKLTPFVTRVYPPTHKWAGMTYAVPCDCPHGHAVEAGAWFRRIYEQEGNQRVKNESAERELAALLKAHPEKARWLPDAIEQCRLRYEAKRKRTLQGLSDRANVNRYGGGYSTDEMT